MISVPTRQIIAAIGQAAPDKVSVGRIRHRIAKQGMNECGRRAGRRANLGALPRIAGNGATHCTRCRADRTAAYRLAGGIAGVAAARIRAGGLGEPSTRGDVRLRLRGANRL